MDFSIHYGIKMIVLICVVVVVVVVVFKLNGK
jgi:hypothetical protein